MDGFAFFKVYQALKLHFTSSYDIFKYRGQTAHRSKDKFELRRDKHIFNGWARTFNSDKEAGQFCIANFFHGSESWVYDNDKRESRDIYLRWLGNREAITKVFTDSCNLLKGYLEDGRLKHYSEFLIKTPKGNKPPLLQLYLTGKLIPDTMVIFDTIGEPFLNRWLTEFDNDPLVKSKVYSLIKYRTFCVYDANSIISIFKEVLES